MRLPWVAAPGWWVGARCRIEQIPVSHFFLREESHEARAFCRSCLVRQRCLTEHLDEPFGVWGGHTRDERNKIMIALDRGSSLADASRKIDERRRK